MSRREAQARAYIQGELASGEQAERGVLLSATAILGAIITFGLGIENGTPGLPATIIAGTLLLCGGGRIGFGLHQHRQYTKHWWAQQAEEAGTDPAHYPCWWLTKTDDVPPTQHHQAKRYLAAHLTPEQQQTAAQLATESEVELGTLVETVKLLS